MRTFIVFALFGSMAFAATLTNGGAEEPRLVRNLPDGRAAEDVRLVRNLPDGRAEEKLRHDASGEI